MDSELASDGIQGDRLFAGSTRNYLVCGVAPGLLFEPVSKDINSTTTGSASKCYGCFDYRIRGVSMLLKLIVLSSASLALWLAPLVGLDKKVGWHKGIQGASLCAALACSVRAGNLARKLAREAEVEAIKDAAINADVVDEIATSAYVSQAQRQNEAELLIAGNGDRELLERALALSSEDVETENDQLAQNADNELRERILQLQAIGYGKGKVISEIWQVSKGGSPKYKAAEAEYRRLTGDF
jgi:hypothetical protein